MILVIQLIIAIIIVVLIILQERSAGLSGIFGGDMGGGGVYQTRRGFEKAIFVATIVFSVIFIGLAIAQLFLKR